MTPAQAQTIAAARPDPSAHCRDQNAEIADLARAYVAARRRRDAIERPEAWESDKAAQSARLARAQAIGEARDAFRDLDHACRFGP